MIINLTMMKAIYEHTNNLWLLFNLPIASDDYTNKKYNNKKIINEILTTLFLVQKSQEYSNELYSWFINNASVFFIYYVFKNILLSYLIQRSKLFLIFIYFLIK